VNEISKIRSDYGLELDAAERVAFIADAERCLLQLGQALLASGLVVDSRVLHTRGPSLSYAGRVVGTYTAGVEQKKSVSIVFAHHPEEIFTRPDGVAAYALHRRHLPQPSSGGGLIDPSTRPEDRVPLKGLYPQAILAHVRQMLEV
jgi:hypothetical protein